jgi:hypothetical protein
MSICLHDHLRIDLNFMDRSSWFKMTLQEDNFTHKNIAMSKGIYLFANNRYVFVHFIQSE